MKSALTLAANCGEKAPGNSTVWALASTGSSSFFRTSSCCLDCPGRILEAGGLKTDSGIDSVEDQLSLAAADRLGICGSLLTFAYGLKDLAE